MEIILFYHLNHSPSLDSEHEAFTQVGVVHEIDLTLDLARCMMEVLGLTLYPMW